PDKKTWSSSGLHWLQAVLKCSPNQVNVSELVSDFLYSCAALLANFSIMGSGSTLRMSALSLLNPLTSKALLPKVSHSGISNAPYRSNKFPGLPCAWFTESVFRLFVQAVKTVEKF